MNNQIIIEGKSSLSDIKDIIQNKKTFMVSGKNSFVKSGAKKIIDSLNINYFWFNDFSSNPKIEQVERGNNLFKQNNYESIVAIGGGSSIDVAKAIKLQHYKETNNKIPIIACPTTAGSGSESTYFIVYYKDKEKQSEGDPEITLPEYVILDHNLLQNLPQHDYASSVLDALSQAIESYWSIYSTEESRQLSASSLALIKGYALKAVLQRDDLSQQMMMRAANLAGQAINITKTTACHSLAYPMTSYFNISHGHACSLTLSQILQYNYEVDNETLNDSRGIDFVKKIIEEILLILDLKNTTEFHLWLKLFITKLGLKYNFEDLGINTSVIIKYGFNPDRVKNNPKILTEKNLKDVL
jgi:alcohol dehydrogenase class IV